MFKKYSYLGIDPAPGSTGSDQIARTPVKETRIFPLLSTILSEEKETDTFSIADVEAKLKQAEKESDFSREECAIYGLEDENGGTVKVWIPKEQEKEFAQALEYALASARKQFDEQQQKIEIAEILFSLKDKFDIVNVEWPEVPEEDEETDTATPPPAEGEAIDPEGEMPEGEEGLEGEGMEGMEDMGSEESSTSTILNKLLDMLKAQADARKAEAKATQSKYAHDVAVRKMGQEEDIMDMQRAEDAAKEEKKESNLLQKLAKYKLQKSSLDMPDME